MTQVLSIYYQCLFGIWNSVSEFDRLPNKYSMGTTCYTFSIPGVRSIFPHTLTSSCQTWCLGGECGGDEQLQVSSQRPAVVKELLTLHAQGPRGGPHRPPNSSTSQCIFNPLLSGGSETTAGKSSLGLFLIIPRKLIDRVVSVAFCFLSFFSPFFFTKLRS